MEYLEPFVDLVVELKQLGVTLVDGVERKSFV